MRSCRTGRIDQRCHDHMNWNAGLFTELLKVYDGIASFRHHSYKLISVPRHISVEQLVGAAMWAFHLTGDPGKKNKHKNPHFDLVELYWFGWFIHFCFVLFCFVFITADFYLTDLCGNSEKEIDEPNPIPSLTRIDGRKPALLLRFRSVSEFICIQFHYFSAIYISFTKIRRWS